MAAAKRRYVAIIIALLLIVGIPGYLTMYTSPDPDYSEPQTNETTRERKAGDSAPALVLPGSRRSGPQDPATMPPEVAVPQADVPTYQEPGADRGVSEYVNGCHAAEEMQIQDADARGVTLKIATAAPESSYVVQRLREAAALVKTQTAGRVSIKLYPGGVMGPDHKVLQKMGRIGTLHGAMLSSASLDQVVEALRIYRLPLLFRSADEVAQVRGIIDPQLHDALRDRCFVSFQFAGNGFSHLFSREPVQTEQDLDGKNIWNPSGDEVFYWFFEELSAAASLVPMIDVMVSLQTQLLDVVPASPLTVLLLQWHNHLEYVTDLPLSYSYNLLVFDAMWFSRVAPADQNVVAAALNAAMVDFDTASFPSYREALQTLTEGGYIRSVPADPAFQAWLEVRARETTMKMIADGKLPKDLTLQALQILEDYRAAAP
jgi:TRAP-type C4-dicarboxylate transport system substrate-binding protein